MNEKPATIRCSKCGAPGTLGTPVCSKCGGRVVKSCGECQFNNSLAKNFCDSCGTPLKPGEPPKPAAAPAKPPPPGGPPSGDLPRTVILRAEPSAKTPPPEEKPRRPTSVTDPLKRRNTRPPAPAPIRAPKTAAPRPKAPPLTGRTLAAALKARLPSPTAASLALPAALLLTGLGYYGWGWRQANRPEILAVKVAETYLAALRSGDLPTAYSMLSSEARAQCSLEEFRRIRPPTAWDWSNVRLERLEGDVALLRYTMAPLGRSAVEETLSLVKEGRRWVRPFIWSLLDRIEDALGRGENDPALSLAQIAVSVDPRDALAQAYVCEAGYKRRTPQETETECRKALELAGRGPHRLTPATLRYMHSILGDLYKSTLDNPSEAVRAYDAVTTFPGLKPAEECDILLARGESRMTAGDEAGALKDFEGAAGPCADAEDVAYLRRGKRVLSGGAGPEAVALAQQYRMQEGGPTLLEWRQEERRDLAAQIQGGGSGAELPKERWSAEHLGGPRYKVTLRTETAVLLTTHADLWTNTVSGVGAQTP